MLKVGQRVKIKIPLNEQTASVTIKQFNGTITEIEEANRYRTQRNTTYYLYKLKDIVSAFGSSFCFIEDWLIPQDEYEVSE